jgi:uncharacterized protein YbcI
MASEHHRTTGGHLNQEIANAVVRERKRAFGRGPVKAQAFFRQNIVVVVMEDTLSEAEHALAESGQQEEVLRMRLRLEATIRDRLIETVERLTGCRVEALMGTNHISPDLAADVFVLDRDIPVERPSRAAA